MPEIINSNVELRKESRSMTFRNESFEIVYHYYYDKSNEESFTTESIDELNLVQVHNQYRYKHGIPFVDEIKAIRSQYGLSASKMGEVLGLSPNSYKNYENGDIPSVSNGRFIQLAKDPNEFRKLLELNKDIEEHEFDKIHKKISGCLNGWNKIERIVSESVFGLSNPSIYTGYRLPVSEKIGNMVKYFCYHLNPFTTKMNKLLFYADFLHYSRRGYGISGLRYKAITRGPVPKNYGSIYSMLMDQGFFDSEIVQFEQGEGEKFLSNTEPELELFEDSEIQVLNDVVKHLGKLSTNQIVNTSHDEDGWQHNVDNFKEINYQYAFALKHIE